MKILVAVDGSKPSLQAVKCLIDHAGWYRGKPKVELVTVRPEVPRLPRMGLAVSRAQIDRYYVEEGQAALRAAKRMLDAARVPYKSHIFVGPVAEAIVKHAKAAGCDVIYVGSRGMGAIGKALLGSTAGKVLQLSSVPVLLVK